MQHAAYSIQHAEQTEQHAACHAAHSIMQSRQHSTARHCIADSRALPCCPQPEQGFSHRQPEQGFSQALRLEAARLQPGRFLESQRGNAKQTDTQTDTDMPCTDTSTDRDMHCRQTQPCIAPLPSSCRQPCSARQQTWGRRSWQNRLADTHRDCRHRHSQDSQPRTACPLFTKPQTEQPP